MPAATTLAAGQRLSPLCRTKPRRSHLPALRAGRRIEPELSAGGLSRAVIPAKTAEPGLFVRSWRPGDVLHPLGLSGRKKVQDLFVDRKVPRGERHLVPIVTAADGRIVWVAGVALGEAFRVTQATKSVVVLSFESLGGSSR